MPRLHINLMGSIEIRFDDKRLEHVLSNKAIALISFLIIDIGKGINKEKLIAFLWADSDTESAKYNLRYNLWNIKKIIPEDQFGQRLILSHRDHCMNNPKYNFSCDALQIIKSDHIGSKSTLDELNAYKKLFRGDFLEGIHLKNCDEFNDMIILERTVYQNKYVELLKLMVAKYEANKNYQECVQLLNELFNNNPYDEQIVYKMISVLAAWKKRGEAINYYKKFETSLKRDLNISPCNELKLLYGKLLDEQLDNEQEYDNIARVKKQKIEIEIICIESIEYFCISEIVKEIILKGDKKYIFGFNKCYLEDLNFIQLDVGLGYDKLFADKCAVYANTPPVRIADAFFKFIRYICEACILNIHIINYQNMDKTSKDFINYIIRLKIKDLNIINLSRINQVITHETFFKEPVK